MKALITLTRTSIIGALWSAVYAKGLQEFMIHNWRFNLFRGDHWRFIWNLWLDGWVIDETREVLFFFSLVFFIPIWLAGWTAFCIINWGGLFSAIFGFPIRLFKKAFFKPKKAAVAIKKKKSKYTRPNPVRGRITPSKPDKPKEAPKPEPEDDLDYEERPAKSYDKKPSVSPSASVQSSSPPPAPVKKSTPSVSIEKVIEDAGYATLTNLEVAGQKIDFVAVSSEKTILLLVDSEEGDWLADEERFNDEEPLWFSESNHRISPVRKIINAREALISAFSDEAVQSSVSCMVVVNQGTIINAEDMFEIWDELDVIVCRTQDGGPDELKKVEEVVPKNRAEMPNDSLLDNIRKAISSAG